MKSPSRILTEMHAMSHDELIESIEQMHVLLIETESYIDKIARILQVDDRGSGVFEINDIYAAARIAMSNLSDEDRELLYLFELFPETSNAIKNLQSALASEHERMQEKIASVYSMGIDEFVKAKNSYGVINRDEKREPLKRHKLVIDGVKRFITKKWSK